MAARALEGVRALQQRTSLIVDGFHPHAIPALAEEDPDADAATESDSESVSVVVPQQPTPARQPQQQASGSQCLHLATRVLAGSVPLFVAGAMMLEGDRRGNPALVITGAATLAAVAGQLVAAGLNRILDDVVARCCGPEPEAGQAAV